jgi:AcrR family transcriptional regulator
MPRAGGTVDPTRSRPALPLPHLLPPRSPMVVSPPTDSLRRRRAPRGSGDLLRDEILDAATQLLLDTGHAKAVSIRSVAERVGVTPPSIYLHFQDKDALLDAVCARYFEKLDEEMQRVSAVQSSTVEVLRAQGLAYVRFATENPELYRIATMGEWRSGSNVDSALASSAFAHMCGAVGVLMDEGVFPRGDAAAVALELWSAAHGAASLLIAKPHLPFGDAEAFTDRVLRAVFLGHMVAGLVGVDDTPEQVVEQLTALKSSVRGSS